ncbi:MAG: hypothetical protein ABR511_04005 [Acidimicrobiales bacterium]
MPAARAPSPIPGATLVAALVVVLLLTGAFMVAVVVPAAPAAASRRATTTISVARTSTSRTAPTTTAPTTTLVPLGRLRVVHSASPAPRPWWIGAATGGAAAVGLAFSLWPGRSRRAPAPGGTERAGPVGRRRRP